MRTYLPLGIFLMVALSIPIGAQQAAFDRVARAAALNDQGKFHDAIALVEPLTNTESQTARDVVTGMAWNLSGVAYQNLGDYDKAWRNYEFAIDILRSGPAWRVQYASALDNLGSLYLDLGELKAAQSLRLRAKQLYESENDHAGIARASTNLATIALVQDHRKEALHNLTEASREESLVPAPDPGDLASLFIVQCDLNMREKNYPAALSEIDHAIELWKQRYGPQYYMLAAGYSHRGQMYDKLGDHRNALGDFERALALFKQSDKSNSAGYFVTVIAYARALRNAGMKDEASQTEMEARTALAGFHHRQCAGCTISAQSFE